MPPKKRTDMTDEEYDAICERLRKARVVAQEKLRNKPVKEEAPAPVHEPEPEHEPEYEPEPEYQAPAPPKKAVRASRAKVAVAKPEPVNLDEYFQAKYRAKAMYLPVQEEPIKQTVTAPPVSSNHLLQQTAREQIRGRVNNEMFNLAMKSVFPSY